MDIKMGDKITAKAGSSTIVGTVDYAGITMIEVTIDGTTDSVNLDSDEWVIEVKEKTLIELVEALRPGTAFKAVADSGVRVRTDTGYIYLHDAGMITKFENLNAFEGLSADAFEVLI